MLGREELKKKIDDIFDSSALPWRKAIAATLQNVMKIEEEDYKSLQKRIKIIENRIEVLEESVSKIEKSLQPLSER